MDLVCLVADRNQEAAIEGLLGRSPALGIRPIDLAVVVHPRRDPGCFHEAADLLRSYRASDHAVVLLDASWDGTPSRDPEKLEKLLEDSLTRAGLGEWARALVIDPELESWVFSESPHVATELGWRGAPIHLRDALEGEGLWPHGKSKPPDPKSAMEWALWQARRPRSSSIYRSLAERVSLKKCHDRSFLKLRALLREWFGTDRKPQGSGPRSRRSSPNY